MVRYIDADALSERIKEVYCTDCDNCNEIRCCSCGIEDALIQIDSFPVAAGVWLNVRKTIKKGSCTLTGTYPRYCPNCGALMEGEDHE